MGNGFWVLECGLTYIGMRADDDDTFIPLSVASVLGSEQLPDTLIGHDSIDTGNDEYFVTANEVLLSLFDPCEVNVPITYRMLIGYRGLS